MTPEDIRDLNEAGTTTWECPKCGAMVHDIVDNCPVCIPETEPAEVIDEVVNHDGTYRPGVFCGIKRNEIEQHPVVVQIVGHALFQCLGLEAGDYDDLDDLDETYEQLGSHYDMSDDGFELGKTYDDLGYHMSMSRCQDLDGFSSDASKLYEVATQAWVRDNPPTKDFKVFDRVKFRDMRHGEVVGEVTQVKPGVAKIHVFSEALGHVRDGLGVHATILCYEDVELVD